MKIRGVMLLLGMGVTTIAVASPSSHVSTGYFAAKSNVTNLTIYDQQIKNINDIEINERSNYSLGVGVDFNKYIGLSGFYVDSDLSALYGIGLDVGYTFQFDKWKIKPYVDLDAERIDRLDKNLPMWGGGLKIMYNHLFADLSLRKSFDDYYLYYHEIVQNEYVEFDTTLDFSLASFQIGWEF
ncbi:hypothetical protein LQM11_004178 [Vibrio parahaemolyticus]|uniref:hypothetical protein n=1 Tax=Vibrio parahaemolyticus TaxID=670 RepID=UPI0015BB473F|nr:hypothetical protein [Vibrio parahaemolyticus]EIO4563542.1 hypothetical protein [Vibrio parahaemolyticus]QLE29487.1 hypothetical protein FDV78_02135 [Vibrio parahaemolyticus]